MNTLATDPVCGMTVDPATAPASAEANGTTYHICAPGCQKAFLKSPHTYTKGGKRGGTTPLTWGE